MRKFFLILIFALFSFVARKGYFQLTDGFSIRNISSDYSYHSEWEIPQLSSQEKKEFNKIISQKFCYLTKGCQN